MSGPDRESEAPPESALEPSALAEVLRWPYRRHLEVLYEDALYGPLGPEAIERKLALAGFELAAGELLAAHATDREGRRRAAEVLIGSCIRALLSPAGMGERAALQDLELARRGFDRDGVAWGGIVRFGDRMKDRSLSPTERAAAGAALWASHLALGDPPGEAGRLAFATLHGAFAPDRAASALAVALSHLERMLAEREIPPKALIALAEG